MHGQAVRQGALTEIVLEQKAFADIEFGKRSDDLVELGLHWDPETTF
jgi:hypothetical protein